MTLFQHNYTPVQYSMDPQPTNHITVQSSTDQSGYNFSMMMAEAPPPPLQIPASPF